MCEHGQRAKGLNHVGEEQSKVERVSADSLPSHRVLLPNDPSYHAAGRGDRVRERRGRERDDSGESSTHVYERK